MTDYENLKAALHDAICICDPIDFQRKQRDLLLVVANYLIERDKPAEQSECADV